MTRSRLASSRIGPRICLGCWAACGRSVTRRALSSAPTGRSITNMERLWRALQRTKARYWVFLDDDIEFLGGDVLGDCVQGHGAASVGRLFASSPPSTRSTNCATYEPWRRELLEQGIIEERDAGWMTGYFMLVDRDQVGDIGPDMNLPDPCTAIDTSYSVAIRARGLRLGLVPHVCYHTKKEAWANKEVIHRVERYLPAKWGMFYWDCVQYTGWVLQLAGRGQLAQGNSGVP